MPSRIRPMLARSAPAPFDSHEHLFEIKWDGLRAIAFLSDRESYLQSRSGRALLPRFNELERLHEHAHRPCVLDGELVVLDASGVPSFDAVRDRNLSNRPGLGAATYIAFDLLELDGRWHGDHTLEERLAHLKENVTEGGPLLRSRAIPVHGRALFTRAVDSGHEGIVAKSRSSRYEPGRRSDAWIKVRATRSRTIVVGGFTVRDRTHLSAVLVGQPTPDGLRYLGNVGTGWTETENAELAAKLANSLTPAPPFVDPPDLPNVLWVDPVWQGEVDYLQETPGGHLRHPVWRGLV